MKRIILSVVIALVTAFLWFWGTGAMISSGLVYWCLRLPYGLGFPAWMFVALVVIAIPGIPAVWMIHRLLRDDETTEV